MSSQPGQMPRKTRSYDLEPSRPPKMETQEATRGRRGATLPSHWSPVRCVSKAVEERTANGGSRQKRPRGQARIERAVGRCEVEQGLEGGVQMSKAKLRFEDAAEVGTGRRPVRTAIEDPADEIFPTRGRIPEGFLVRLTLARPGEDQRRTVFKHGGEIPAIDAQPMGRTPSVRVETQERCTAVGLGDAFPDVLKEINPV